MGFDVLTKNEAAVRARISRRQLDKQIRAGCGPAVTRIGGAVRVRSDALEAWIEHCTTHPAGMDVEGFESDRLDERSSVVDETLRDEETIP